MRITERKLRRIISEELDAQNKEDLKKELGKLYKKVTVGTTGGSDSEKIKSVSDVLIDLILFLERTIDK